MPVRFLSALFLAAFVLSACPASAQAPKDKKPFNPFDDPDEPKAKPADLPVLAKVNLLDKKRIDTLVLNGIRANKIVQLLNNDPPAYMKAPGLREIWPPILVKLIADEQMVVDGLPQSLAEITSSPPGECIKDTLERLPSAKKYYMASLTKEMLRAENGFDKLSADVVGRLQAGRSAVMQKYDNKLTDRAKEAIQEGSEGILGGPLSEFMKSARELVSKNKYLIRAREESEDQK